VLQLAEAEDADGPGLFAVTDRRIIWHYVARGAEGDEDAFRETPRDALSDVRAEVRDDGGVLLFRVGDEDEPSEIDRIVPPEAAAALAEALGGEVAPPPEPPAEPAGRGRTVRERLRLRAR
jgi:hypothetical protein